MSLDMNDFVHMDSLYLPRSTNGSGPTLCSAIELLSTHVAPSIQERSTPARIMHLPSARPTLPPSTDRGTSAKEFNVGEYLVDRPSPVVLGGEQGSTNMVRCLSTSQFTNTI